MINAQIFIDVINMNFLIIINKLVQYILTYSKVLDSSDLGYDNLSYFVINQ